MRYISKLKDARIYHLQKQFNCTLQELREDHADVLSHPLWKYIGWKIKHEQYIHGLNKRFKDALSPDNIILVHCYYCNKRVHCTVLYSDRRKGIVFCDNRCRNRCKVDRSRYIDGTLTSRRLTALFDGESDTYHKKVNHWLDTRIQREVVSEE